MRNIFIIAKKETIDILRDKRTLRAMIIVPLVIFPLLLSIINKISYNQNKKEKEKTLIIGFVCQDSAKTLIDLIQREEDIKLVNYKNISEIYTLVKCEKIDGALIIEKDFDLFVSNLETGNISLYYKSTNKSVRDKLMQIIDCYNRFLRDTRLDILNISQSQIEPIRVNIKDISSGKEKFVKFIGGFLPYILIIFSFVGCIFPAIQLFSNEKEQGTLETLFISPVNRYEILFGKMFVIVIIGLLTSIISIIGLCLGMVNTAHTMPPEVLSIIYASIQPLTIIMFFVMLIPLIIFFASLLTLITTYANSYKEAQSIISPLTSIIVLPAILGLIPGINLNIYTAAIPITNIALALKEIIAGTLNFYLFGLVMLLLFCYAFICILISSKFMNNESYLAKI